MILTIHPGGKLYRTKDSGTAEDVTSKIPFFTQFYECKIIEGVTLRDIFLLLQRDIAFWKILVNNYVECFVEEGLKPPREPVDLDFLELYYWIEIEDGKLIGLTHPEFHGHKDNQSFAIDFCAANDLAHLPVKLGGLRTCKKTYTPSYTLGDIICGIIWELSFYGPPEERDETSEMLMARYNDVIEREVDKEI